MDIEKTAKFLKELLPNIDTKSHLELLAFCQKICRDAYNSGHDDGYDCGCGDGYGYGYEKGYYEGFNNANPQRRLSKGWQ